MDLMQEPLVWLLAVLLLSLVGLGTNLGLYQLGKEGRHAVEERFPQIGPERWQRVQRLYGRFGTWVILLSGIPLLGPLISTAAGAFDVKLLIFAVLVIVSQLVRNVLIVLAAVGAITLVAG